MNLKTKVIFLGILSLGLISNLIFAQTQTLVAPPVTPSPQPIFSPNYESLIRALIMVLQSKPNSNNKALIDLLTQILQLKQVGTPPAIPYTPTPIVPDASIVEVRSELAPTQPPPISPFEPIRAPVFDEDKSDDNLVQVNNLRVIQINPNPTPDVKAYLTVVKDVGWKCVFYESVDSPVPLRCPSDVRRPLIQEEFVVRVTNDTILLLRNRQRTNISQLRVDDKINVYGFLDKNNFTIDALVVRKVSGLLQPPPPVKPLPAPITTTIPTPITTTIPIGKLPLRWFVGYLEKIMPSYTADVSGKTPDQNQLTHHLTTDNNLIYAVRAIDENVQSLLEKYSNQRVKLYAFVVQESGARETGLLLAKNVISLTSYSTTTPISTSTKRLTVKSISGTLEKAGISIYMWGSHVLRADDGITYRVKPLGKDVQEALDRYIGQRVTIYAKKVEYKNLEGGFWAIEAEKVVSLE